MRDYAKIAPTFWTGETGKEIKRKGMEAVVVATYLMTSPHSNMLGLYYQPVLYMAHETGLGFEGASKGLQWCIEAGFCAFDEDTEMVWVYEMAAFQIADALASTDKRCKGIQKDYEALPRCVFLGPFFDRYTHAFHLTVRRACEPSKPTLVHVQQEAPSKPHRSQEQEQEQENPLTPTGVGPGFEAFWQAWPKSKRKGGKPACQDVWRRQHLESQRAEIIAHVEAMAASTDWTKDDGAFIPAPVVYLRGKRWDGAEIGEQSASGQPEWLRGAI